MCTMLRSMTSGNWLYFLPCCSLSPPCISEQGLQSLSHAPLERSQVPTKPPSITLSHTAIESLHVTRRLLGAV